MRISDKRNTHSIIRPIVVNPRKKGFIHRPIISVIAGIGVTEDGEVIRNLPIFAFNAEPHLWITYEPTDLARTMRDYFSEYRWFCLGGVNAIDPESGIAEKVGIPKGQISTFGFDSKHGGHAPYRKKTARHVICSPVRMFSDIKKARELVSVDHASMLTFMQDVREWCKEQDIPMGKTLSSLGASLLRDKRFWPAGRGKVPRMTNERIRPYLPAVHIEIHTETLTQHRNVIALDQRRAYHTIAQEVATPDPSTLFARGRFTNPDTDKLWTRPGNQVYERVTRQPGLLAVKGISRSTRKGEPRLPCLNHDGMKTFYLWSNELSLAQRQGLDIVGLTAAWTSNKNDEGLPRYGKWAASQINQSNSYRRQWLKSTLHSTYGLLGARPRTLEFVEYNGTSEDMVEWYFRGYKFRFHRRILENFLPAFANSAMLGVLQAEVRNRTLTLAMDLIEKKVNVLHTHADGLHIVTEQLPLIEELVNDRWTAETLTHLAYADRVSYVSEERTILPGRSKTQREKLRLSMELNRKAIRWGGLYFRESGEKVEWEDMPRHHHL